MSRSLESLKSAKKEGRTLATLTAYDYPTARLVDEAGIDMILVGDSLGMVVLGYEDTTRVTLEEMLHHTRACHRAVKSAPLIGDLPYHTYTTPEQALGSARALMGAGADAVKLEGGEAMLPQLEAIRDDGIPLIGHIGMLPQQVKKEGGYKKKGKTPTEADQLQRDARLLADLGVIAIVLESMLPKVAAAITRDIPVPTIGIGAGRECDGQILVLHDLLGSFPWFRPSFAKPRADLARMTTDAVQAYIAELRAPCRH
ncbi:MAG: 3-methyl-2-oxobutanoate hydroxymethyltransferase [Verrucomicrobiota bacterium]